jgi:hypothetical protein
VCDVSDHKTDKTALWISCNAGGGWQHAKCAGFAESAGLEKKLSELAEFVCAECKALDKEDEEEVVVLSDHSADAVAASMVTAVALIDADTCLKLFQTKGAVNAAVIEVNGSNKYPIPRSQRAPG